MQSCCHSQILCVSWQAILYGAGLLWLLIGACFNFDQPSFFAYVECNQCVYSEINRMENSHGNLAFAGKLCAHRNPAYLQLGFSIRLVGSQRHEIRR